ncbi:hypothetical protein [Polaromonas hydrogenivorans]|uniref:Uncharacterized protein n=1 Tax=Polaromonas hydrogenivorans TaxID=335476 RepID=A0AAU7LQL1_9BURK
MGTGLNIVIPAQAGIQLSDEKPGALQAPYWIPACAGMTNAK